MNKCRGILIPQYKTIKETSWKLKKDSSAMYLCTDIVQKEVESICADCKQVICKEDYATRKE